MSDIYMKGKDAVAGALAECYFTIGGKRYYFMQLISFEAKVEIDITDVPILGRTAKAHKSATTSGTWSGTAHYNQSILRELMLKYQNTGELETFTIQVTVDDPASSAGSQTTVLYDCLLDGGIVAKFDADAEYLDEDISGTFDSWDMPGKFTTLAGMQTN